MSLKISLGITAPTALDFVQTRLPTVYEIVKDGQSSSLFKITEKAHSLLYKLQLDMLPYEHQNFCVEHYVRAQTAKNAAAANELFTAWIAEEDAAIRKAFCQENEQMAYVPLIRRSIYQVVYEEQEALKARDPFQPFSSIYAQDGDINHLYSRTEKALLKKQVAQVEKAKTECLTARGFTNLSRGEMKLVDAVTMAHCEALLKQLQLDDQPYLKIAASQQPEVEEEQLSKRIAQEKWKAIFDKEKQLFTSFIKEVQLQPPSDKFREGVRAVIFRRLYEDQQKLGERYPFVSICAKDGQCNARYWIDLLNAKARMQNERACDPYRDLDKLSDLDAVRIDYTPFEEENAASDTRGLRKTGAVTPDFCSQVIEKTQNSGTTPQERAIINLQQAFFDAMSAMNAVRFGLKKILSQINITVNPATDSTLQTTPRKSPTFSASPRGFTSIRKSGGGGADPVLLRKSTQEFQPLPSPRALTPRESPKNSPRAASQDAQQALLDPSTLEKDCDDFLKHLQSLALARKASAAVLTKEEKASDILTWFNMYNPLLNNVQENFKRLSEQLSTFSENEPFKETAKIAFAVHQVFQNVYELLAHETASP